MRDYEQGKPSLLGTTFGREGWMTFGGQVVIPVDVWQHDAELAKLVIPQREYDRVEDPPSFRLANPVDEAEALGRAIDLQEAVEWDLTGKKPLNKPTALWESDFANVWIIRPPRDSQGVKPPSRRISAKKILGPMPTHLRVETLWIRPSGQRQPGSWAIRRFPFRSYPRRVILGYAGESYGSLQASTSRSCCGTLVV